LGAGATHPASAKADDSETTINKRLIDTSSPDRPSKQLRALPECNGEHPIRAAA